jgi:NADH:ubiquinone oxidoreductase subunit 2 (subunit N)
LHLWLSGLILILVCDNAGIEWTSQLYVNMLYSNETGYIIEIALFLCYFLVIVSQSSRFIYSRYEIYFLQLLIVLMLYLALVSKDLLSLFFSLEGYALCTYILITATCNNKLLYNHKQTLSTLSSEAAIKNFLAGTFFGLLFLYGCSLIYYETGCVYFGDIETLFTSLDSLSFSLLLAYVLIFSALFSKLGAAPLHF